MPEIKLQHIVTLVQLLAKGARHNFVEVTTGDLGKNIGRSQQAASKLIDQFAADAIVITLDKDGAFLATRDGKRRLLRTRARSVADVTGAGDMFLAMLAAAHAAGATWTDATALANVASGLEVERFGAVPVRPEEIVAELMSEMRDSAGKRRTLDELVVELARHRAAGKRIVFTNG